MGSRVYSRSRSRNNAIVQYDRDRSRSSSSHGKRRRSPSYKRRSRSRSRARSKDKEKEIVPQSEEARLALEKFNQQKFAKEQAAARVEASVKAVEAAQKALEAATAADLEAANKLQELSQEVNKVVRKDRLQKLVDDREDCRRARDMDKAKEMMSTLRALDCDVNDNECTWKTSDGLSGLVKGGLQWRPGDWRCPSCSAVVFCHKKLTLKCWRCGARKPDDDGKGGGRRRSPSYDDRDRRGGDRRRDDRRDRGRRARDDSRSRNRRSPSYR